MAKGYVRKRGNNKWQMEVDLGSYIDPKTGKRKRNKKYKTITAKKQRDAELELVRFVAEVTGEGYSEPEKMRFVDFVYKEWLPKHAEKHLSHTTLSTYLRFLELRIIPAFQFFRLDQVKPKHILDFLHNLEEEGMRLDGKSGKLSSNTIMYHYRILNSIFSFAESLKLIPSNPVKSVDRPKVKTKKIEVYDLNETIKLLQCLDEELLHWQVIIKLAITTGMRRSELLGLEFKHIDFENNVIRVSQAVTYSKEKGIQVHEVKKGNGNSNYRKITISKTLIEPLKKLELIRKKEALSMKKEDRWGNGEHNFLLCDITGKPYNPTSMQRWWERFIKRHGLKYINIHALRHTAATLLINEGIHPKIISERLGHADIRTTMNIYGHALKQADQKATEKLDLALSKVEENY